MSVVEADDDDSVHLERECREERLCGLVVVVVDVSSACRNGRVDKVRDCGFRRLSLLCLKHTWLWLVAVRGTGDEVAAEAEE